MMASRRPAREHWLDVHRATLEWQQSGLAEDAGRRVVAALWAWFGDHPSDAANIERLAVSGAQSALISRSWMIALECSEVGLEAGSLRVRPAEDWLALVLLHAALGEGALHAGRPAPLRRALSGLDLVLAGAPVGTSASTFGQGRAALLRAGALEANLDRGRALLDYRSAASALDEIVGSESTQEAIVSALVAATWGDLPARPGGESSDGGQRAEAQELIRAELGRLTVAAHAGAVRCSNSPFDARELVAAIERCGLPRSALPFEVRPAVLALSPEEARRAVTRIEACLDERVHGERVVTAWQAALRSALAVRLLDEGDEQGAVEAFDTTLEAAQRPLERRAGLQWMLDQLVVTPRRPTRRLVEGVFQVLPGALADASSAEFAVLRFQYDRGVGRCVDSLFNKRAVASSSGRALLTAAVDALREPTPPPGDLLGSRTLHDVAVECLDAPARLADALRGRPGEVVVLEQRVGGRTCFLWVRGGPDPLVETSTTGDAYAEAAARLSAELARHLDLPFVEPEDERTLADLGRLVHSLLPEGLRDALGDAQVVVAVADPLSGGGGLAAELLHDGDTFLGLRAVVSRGRSLLDALTIIEPAAEPHAAPVRRALLVAADAAPGHPELPDARVEVETLAEQLRSDRWEVASQFDPEASVESATLSAENVLEAAELAALVHVAAHGELVAGQQVLVLPNGDLLTVDDIERRTRRLSACMFVNACSLGASRAAGAGIDRGLAAALRKAGAPAVVANLGPVFDVVGTELAVELYRAAAHTTIGDALLAARRALAARGRATSQWAAAILLGDPHHRLGAERPVDRVVGALLPAGAALPPVQDEPAVDAPTRQRAARAWVDAARTATDIDIVDNLARLAVPLGHQGAVALMALAGLAEGDEPHDASLDRVLDALHPLRQDPNWYDVRQMLLTERNRLRPGVEPPEISAGGLSVNDRSDPAVAAILDLQRAVDEEEIRREGERSLRPEASDADFADNCVLLGRCARFGDDARGEAAATLAVRAALRASDDGDATAVVFALRALLPVLWASQRMTHLELERAVAQSSVVQHVLRECWQPPPDQAARLDEALRQVTSPAPAARFARALVALADDTPGGGTERAAAALRDALVTPDDATAPDHVGWLLWSTGATLTAADALKTRGDRGLAAQLEAVAQERDRELHDAVVELHWMTAPTSTNSFLAGWRWTH